MHNVFLVCTLLSLQLSVYEIKILSILVVFLISFLYNFCCCFVLFTSIQLIWYLWCVFVWCWMKEVMWSYRAKIIKWPVCKQWVYQKITKTQHTIINHHPQPSCGQSLNWFGCTIYVVIFRCTSCVLTVHLIMFYPIISKLVHSFRTVVYL